VTAQDMPDEGTESKALAERKWWIALCVDVLEHEVVGPNVKSPRAADPAKQVWQPFAVWVWMLAEAAHKDRVRNMKGRHISLRRGQLAVAERYLARMANWTRKGAALFLSRLARHDMVTLSTLSRDGQFALDFAGSKRGPDKGPTLTIVTISNYDKYQHTPTRKGAALGAAKGPTRGQSLTSNTPTFTGESSRSPKEINLTQKDACKKNEPSGTDGALGDRLPFTEEALAACEQMGFTRQTLVERYEKRTKGRRIRDPSAYLIKMAVDMAAKARGVSEDAVRGSISKNAGERLQAYAAADTVPSASEAMCAIVSRRVKRAKRDPNEMFKAWRAKMTGVRMINPDSNIDAFCSQWLRDPAQGRAA